jgi:hypothetical protein
VRDVLRVRDVYQSAGDSHAGTPAQALKQATQLRVLDVRGGDVSEKWVQATKKNCGAQLSILHAL